ncbi:MAG: hypothetical protein BA867_10955 [Desulfobacterales bacterium S5133MH16]|nr:MAG: hypothetical protein BA867_10955 [Desulfobacterales bacterium S5133MH16]
MKWFLYAISLFCVTIGCCTILYTNESRNVLRNIFNKIDRKILSAFEAIMGILLVVSATASHHSWLIRLIGFMAVIEGGIIFFIPKNLYDELIDWYLNSASDQTYRLFGIVTLILGTAVLSWIL